LIASEAQIIVRAYIIEALSAPYSFFALDLDVPRVHAVAAPTPAQRRIGALAYVRQKTIQEVIALFEFFASICDKCIQYFKSFYLRIKLKISNQM
jgi:hypothetical protein